MSYPVLTWVSAAGQELNLNPTEGPDAFRLVVNRLEGLGEVLVDFQTTKAPYQDGSTWLDSPLEDRDLRIRCNLFTTGTAEMAALRDEIIRAFNPKLGPGILAFQAAETSPMRLVVAIPDGVPVFPSERVNMGRQECEIALRAVEPHWIADDDEEDVVLEGVPAEINNEGHDICPVEITITGPATNPIIANVTEDSDTYIEWEGTVATGQTLVIKTGFQQKGAWLDGANRIGDIALLSTFWWLFVGVNDITFEATGTDTDTSCTIKWRPRYVGI